MSRALPAAVFLLVVLAAATAGQAQTGSRLMLEPFRTSDEAELNAQGMFQGPTHTGNTDLGGQAFDFRADIYDLEGRFRLTPGRSVRGIARAQPRVGFATHYAQLQTDDPALPTELFDTSVAVGMGVLSAQGWIGGALVGVGHAGADFEEDGNAMYVQADFVLGKTFENGDAFGLVLDFDGNRSFLPDWPLPGFQVRKRLDRPGPPAGPPQQIGPGVESDQPSDPPKLVLALGLPFTEVEWRPTEALRLEVTYVLPESFGARVDWTLLGNPQITGVSLYGSMNRTLRSFHWNDLPDHDRLFFNQWFGEVGMNWQIHDRLELVLAGGWAFRQSFTTGWDTRDTEDVADIDDAPYLRAMARIRL